jgi:hypothetical protein
MLVRSVTSAIGHQLPTESRQSASAIPWADIRDEWQESRYTEVQAAVSALAGEPVGDEVRDLLFAKEDPEPSTARSVLHRAFEKAASSAPDEGSLLVALCVYGLCLEKWEKTEDYARIRTILEALEDVCPRPADGSDGRAGLPARLLSVLVSQTRLLDFGMGVEEAMNCSCPVAMSERARQVVDGLEPLIRELDGPLSADGGLVEDLAELRSLVRADAAANRLYFEKIFEVAETVLQFLAPDAAGPPAFERVLTSVAEAELDSDLDDEEYVSELRAHRASLQALSEHADDPRLRVDAADLVYVYPFTLDGIEAKDAVARAVRGDVTKALEDAGFGPAHHGVMAVNDLWDRGDSGERGYSGESIELPEITVETTAHRWLEEHYPGDFRLRFLVEARMSSLGNHYLRISSSFEEAGLHEVNQALRRGSRAMGAEKLRFEGHSKIWDKVPDYADEVIAVIAEALCAEPVKHLSALFHVVLEARAISVEHPDGGTSPATAESLEKALGAQLLFHPVRHLATSLEEWIRYPPPTVNNLVKGQGYVGDLVVRTENTTFLFMPDSPDWLIEEYKDMIEFVASVPPLLALWEHEARRRDRKLESQLARDDVSLGDLHAQELHILELEHEVRRQLAFLHSPALCRTSGQRQFLDRLWEAAGLPALEAEVEQGMTRLAERQARTAALIRSKQQERREQQQERRERLERPVTFVVGFLAAASLAGVLQWLDVAFGISAHKWAILEAVFLGAVALVLAVVIFRAMRSR